MRGVTCSLESAHMRLYCFVQLMLVPIPVVDFSLFFFFFLGLGNRNIALFFANCNAMHIACTAVFCTPVLHVQPVLRSLRRGPVPHVRWCLLIEAHPLLRLVYLLPAFAPTLLALWHLPLGPRCPFALESLFVLSFRMSIASSRSWNLLLPVSSRCIAAGTP